MLVQSGSTWPQCRQNNVLRNKKEKKTIFSATKIRNLKRSGDYLINWLNGLARFFDIKSNGFFYSWKHAFQTICSIFDFLNWTCIRIYFVSECVTSKKLRNNFLNSLNSIANMNFSVKWETKKRRLNITNVEHAILASHPDKLFLFFLLHFFFVDSLHVCNFCVMNFACRM